VRAAYCRTYGTPDVVTVEDIPSPEAGDGQIRVQVHVAAVNFPDALIVADEYQVSVPPPFVPGSEFAGTVGDRRVFGAAFVGAFAEEIVVNAGSVTPIPDGVSFEAAAAFGVAHRTAFHSLRSVAAIQPGEELVVLGAGGGVGLAAVELGALLGASVTAVASSDEKLDVAKAQGATRLVNHRGADLRAALRDALPDGADVVIDPVGGALAEPALRALRWGGRFVTVGYASGDIPRIPLNLVLLKGIRIVGFEFGSFGRNAPDELRRNDDELLALLAAGRVNPHIGARFALDDAAQALAYVAGGRAIGKVLLTVQ
jgi:NADPH2:quinone reductase